MARRALTQEEKTQKQKKEALERDYKETIDRLKFCPEPTYLFNIGDDVCIGNVNYSAPKNRASILGHLLVN